VTRPKDVWRICGHKVDDSPGRGCTCKTSNPSNKTIAAAKKRLGETEGAEKEA
jgi:hypothetical protein